jgi:hypothetical protein
MTRQNVLERIGNALRRPREKLVQLPHRPSEKMALGLGLFSAALGAAELVAPRAVGRLVGVDDSAAMRAALRAAGLRELSAAAGILTSERPAGWLWSRVAGDLMDLGMLSGALAKPSTQRDRTLLATALVMGVTLLDVLCAQELGGAERTGLPPRTLTTCPRGRRVAVETACHDSARGPRRTCVPACDGTRT